MFFSRTLFHPFSNETRSLLGLILTQATCHMITQIRIQPLQLGLSPFGKIDQPTNRKRFSQTQQEKPNQPEAVDPHRTTSYNLRGNYILTLPVPKTTSYGLRSFSYYVVKQWNSLPDNVRTLNLNDFKKSIS